MKDAAFLAALLKEGINVRFTEKKITNDGQDFNRGSLIITKSDNKNLADFDSKLITIANNHKRQLFAASSGFATKGPDFGSPDIKRINKQNIAVLRCDYTSSLSYGAIWHFFETQLKYPITSIDTDDFKRTDLSGFDIIIMPDGYYGSYLDDATLTDVKDFVKSGGKVIALANAVSAFAGKEGFDLKVAEKETKKDAEDSKVDEPNLTPYDQREREGTDDFIIGSIFKTKIDNTHPMAFGYEDTYFSLKLGSDAYQLLNNGYNVSYIQGDAESVSGFSGKKALKKQANTMIFGEERHGSGSFIYMVDDPLFRSFWENGKMFFVNSIFFVNNNKVRI